MRAWDELEQVAQRHQGDLRVGDLNADEALARHRCLDPDRGRGERQRQVVGQGGDLAHLDLGAPAAPPVEEVRLDAELRDGRPAVDLHHVGWRAEGHQRFLDGPGLLAVEGVIGLALDAGLEDLGDLRQRPGGLRGQHFGCDLQRRPQRNWRLARRVGARRRGGCRWSGSRRRRRQRRGLWPVQAPHPRQQRGSRQQAHRPNANGQQHHHRPGRAQAAEQQVTERRADHAPAAPQPRQLDRLRPILGAQRGVKHNQQDQEQHARPNHLSGRQVGQPIAEVPQHKPDTQGDQSKRDHDQPPTDQRAQQLHPAPPQAGGPGKHQPQGQSPGQRQRHAERV